MYVNKCVKLLFFVHNVNLIQLVLNDKIRLLNSVKLTNWKLAALVFELNQ